MKEKKKSFILYDDDIECVSHLTTKQAGKLLQAIVNLRINGEVPDFGNDAALKILFHQITSHIALNEEKYKIICEQRALSAKKRWEARENKQNDANASNPMQTDANRCYNDNENENKNDIVNEYENENEYETENENANGNEKDNEALCAFSIDEAIKKPNYDMSSVENFFASATAMANQGLHRGSS
ncbi:MAG: hypothetical protein J6V06_09750 [Clostridia bacterium]|nr:hypothetical protein [Clostridia bacterium]MBO7320287.1 hypothetical protein [Clostridia bacterium]